MVEVRSADVVVCVDNRQFALSPEARMTMQGAVAFIECAILTGKYKELNLLLATLLARVAVDYRENK